MSPYYGKWETLKEMTKRLKEIIGHQFSTKTMHKIWEIQDKRKKDVDTASPSIQQPPTICLQLGCDHQQDGAGHLVSCCLDSLSLLPKTLCQWFPVFQFSQKTEKFNLKSYSVNQTFPMARKDFHREGMKWRRGRKDSSSNLPPHDFDTKHMPCSVFFMVGLQPIAVLPPVQGHNLDPHLPPELRNNH